MSSGFSDVIIDRKRRLRRLKEQGRIRKIVVLFLDTVYRYLHLILFHDKLNLSSMTDFHDKAATHLRGKPRLLPVIHGITPY
jgi:hypothetical protein